MGKKKGRGEKREVPKPFFETDKLLTIFVAGVILIIIVILVLFGLSVREELAGKAYEVAGLEGFEPVNPPGTNCIIVGKFEGINDIALLKSQLIDGGYSLDNIKSGEILMPLPVVKKNGDTVVDKKFAVCKCSISAKAREDRMKCSSHCADNALVTDCEGLEPVVTDCAHDNFPTSATSGKCEGREGAQCCYYDKNSVLVQCIGYVHPGSITRLNPLTTPTLPEECTSVCEGNIVKFSGCRDTLDAKTIDCTQQEGYECNAVTEGYALCCINKEGVWDCTG